MTEESLLQLLQSCAARAPEPLYPAIFAKDESVDRDQLDVALEELRRRGLLKLTDWVKDLGQGYAPTAAGLNALTAQRLPTARATTIEMDAPSGISHYERGEIVRRAVFAPTSPYVSWVLLAANLLYFAVGAAYGGYHDQSVSDYLQGKGVATNRVLIDLGALHPVLVFADRYIPNERPQFERILLSCFLHVGLLHLLMNMYFLYNMAPIIESMWGSLRFLMIYAIAGIVSGCMILLISLIENLPPLETPLTAGASGCLFGIFVALAVWFWLNREHLPQGVIQDFSRSLGINAVLLIAISFVPGVSWQAHLGGAGGGLLAALLLHVNRFHPSAAMRMLAIAGLPAIPIGFFMIVLWQAKYF